MSEWNEVKLDDICNLIIDYRGKTPKKLNGEWSLSGYRVLSAKNIKTGNLVREDTIRYANATLYKKWMKSEINYGDIILTSEAPFGEVLFWNSYEKIVLGQRLFGVRIQDDCHSKFVYYYMTSKAFQHELRSRATGTTVTGLRQPELLKTIINLPPLATQRKIAVILSSLDDKIENNRKTCEKLEEMAQAVFKRWFVEFEFPNEQGKPHKSSGGKMVDSEMGMIPEGWRVGKLDILAGFKNGKGIDKGNRLEKGKYKIWGSNGVIGYADKALFRLPVIAIGRVGANFGAIHYSIEPCWISDNAITVVPKNTNDFWYLINTMQTINFGNYVAGSAQPLVTQTSIKNIISVIPTRNILNRFYKVISSSYLEIGNMKKQNEKLIQARDTLLPKLMSGELSVEDVGEV